MRAAALFRIAFVAAAAVLIPAAANAQFGPNQKYFGAHVGLSGVGSAPALGLNAEISYNDRIGIGAWVDTWSYGESFGSAFGSVSWDVRYIAMAATGAYHFPLEDHPRLDPFLGVALGYFVVNTTSRGFDGASYSGDASRMFLGGFGGARYAFRENLAGVARVGFGASYLTVGLDFRM